MAAVTARLLAQIAENRLASRDRLVIKGFPGWAAEAQHKPDFSGWLGSSWFTPSSRKGPRIVAYEPRVTFTSTGQTIEHMNVMELRSGYLQEVYAGGRSWPKWKHSDAEGFAAFGGLCMPNARRAGVPREPLVCLDATADYWQHEQLLGTRVELDAATGRWWGNGTWPDPEDLRATKLYISIISHAFCTRKVQRWVRGEPKLQANAFFQPQYGHLITRLHHAKAQEMMAAFEAWRVETDAYWVPERVAEAATTYLWERWHTLVRPKEGHWKAAVSGTSNIRPQSALVREALSASIRGELPPSPGTAHLTVQDRAVMATVRSRSAGTAIDHISPPRPPRAPVCRPSAPERAKAEQARYLADFTAGRLVPPPLPAWMAVVGANLFTPPNRPWLCDGWSLVRADLDPEWFFANDDNEPQYRNEPDDGPAEVPYAPAGPRAPPLDWVTL